MAWCSNYWWHGQRFRWRSHVRGVASLVGSSCGVDSLKGREGVLALQKSCNIPPSHYSIFFIKWNTPHCYRYLIHSMKNLYSKDIDFNNDWKVVTLLIGANDQCKACDGIRYGGGGSAVLFSLFFKGNCSRTHKDADEQLEAVMAQTENALKRIKEGIPKVFVNVVGYGVFFTVYRLNSANLPRCWCWMCRVHGMQLKLLGTVVMLLCPISRWAE